MSDKVKTIKVSFPWTGKNTEPFKMETYEYKILQVTDSVEFYPGQMLCKKQVDELCGAKNWKVTVAPSNGAE